MRSDVMDWYRRAASHGDPVAKAKTLTLSDLRAAKDADIQRSIKEILAAHDPESMLELANLMGQSTDARPEAFGKYSGSEMAADAWRIAACRMGADCSASSPLMILACLGPAACAGNTTPEMIQQNMLSPVAYREAEKMAAQIVADPGH